MENSAPETLAQKLAVAVFVKTPGLSPLKTRLAKTIGEEAALKFYELSCRSIAETLQSPAVKEIVIPYWAVAEEEGFSFWQKIGPFHTIFQGPGTLGEKLHHVYQCLKDRHSAVALIGADAPHLQPDVLIRTARHLEKWSPGRVIGPAADGGFYLFASNQTIAKSIWTGVTYSSSETLKQLQHLLPPIDQTYSESMLHDIDESSDIPQFLSELLADENLSEPLKEIAKFSHELLKSHGKLPCSPSHTTKSSDADS